MKMLTLFMIAGFAVGCTAPPKERKEVLLEGVEVCNTLCINNPKIKEFSYSIGGGLTLLFMGKEEVMCNCK